MDPEIIKLKKDLLQEKELTFLYNTSIFRHGSTIIIDQRVVAPFDYPFLKKSPTESFYDLQLRLKSDFKCRSFFIYLSGLSFNEPVFNKIIKMNNPEGKQILSTNLFLGMYQQTPLGVHFDKFDTFNFQLMGKKDFYLWKFEELKTLQRDKDYENHIDQNVQKSIFENIQQKNIYSLSPKQCLQIPEKYWHMAKSNGEPTLNISFSLN